MPTSGTGLLDSLLDLEEDFYTEGYDLGLADGARAGYTEGSVFAVENGFDKFQEMGRLYGKAIIWAKRLPGEHGLLLPSQEQQQEEEKEGDTTRSSKSDAGNKGRGAGSVAEKVASRDSKLPRLPHNTRLEKHITSLLSLVDPLTLEMENTVEAVEEFDDRLKKAKAKVKIIEKLVGEDAKALDGGGTQGAAAAGGAGETGNIEDIGPLPARMMQKS
ncbi:hypothetical protein AJ80_04192 [Polytolypa hystricis UAMH7299]|uniref:Essential protein Yae1 N-terminal domain-containing protein n=1 Tax=Polytolypa hystricis (strain UAMH7299) TaxID=1447883 RepID=A0A2B7Y4P3_POLH7|nr:hypothetical protein AJ80_04192 [Polytolypa hystricis UAMH7299]